MKSKFRNISVILLVLYIFGFLFVLAQLYYRFPEKLIANLSKLNYNDLSVINSEIFIYLKLLTVSFFVGLLAIVLSIFSRGTDAVLVVEKEVLLSPDGNEKKSEDLVVNEKVFSVLLDSFDDKEDSEEKMKKYLHAVCSEFNMVLGVLYQVDKEEAKCLSTYAFSTIDNRKMDFQKGEGFVGQVLIKKKFLRVANIPEAYTKIITGLGESLPRDLLFIPVLSEEKIVCVLELASFEQLSQENISYIQNVGKKLFEGNLKNEPLAVINA